MNDTHKLLLALIEASGFDVEKINSKTYGHARGLTYQERGFGGARPEMEFQGDGMYKEVTRHVDYKVTKKERVRNRKL